MTEQLSDNTLFTTNVLYMKQSLVVFNNYYFLDASTLHVLIHNFVMPGDIKKYTLSITIFKLSTTIA